MTSDYLISCSYCISQFGLKKNIRKERGRFREHVREKTKIQKQTNKNTIKQQQQNTQTNKNKKLFRCHFSNYVVLCMKAKKSVLSNLFKKIMSGLKLWQKTAMYPWCCCWCESVVTGAHQRQAWGLTWMTSCCRLHREHRWCWCQRE